MPSVKDRPILFSGPMVRAILEGRKTQTRRTMKPQPVVTYGGDDHCSMFEFNKDLRRFDGVRSCVCAKQNLPLYCKFGQAGDRLWVRETWGPCSQGGQCPLVNATYVCFPDGSQKFKSGEYHQWDKPVKPESWPTAWRWKPSIHMPRWASRITLEITDVRVQRLQEISEEDAIAEGAQCAGFPASITNVGAFAKLWEKINGKDSWATNPWVWAVSFKRV